MIKPLSCKFGFSQQTIVSILTGAYWCKLRQGSRFEFHLWVETLILYQSLKVPKLSHYKMMVLNLHRIAENDNMILLQNEALFLSWGYLKGKIHHYKMKICFYHQVTWRGHPTTTKWRFVFIYFLSSGYLKGTLQYYKMTIGNGWKGFSHVAFRRATSLATKWFSIFKRLSTTETLNTYKCNSQAVGTKCLAHPHFFILI